MSSKIFQSVKSICFEGSGAFAIDTYGWLTLDGKKEIPASIKVEKVDAYTLRIRSGQNHEQNVSVDNLIGSCGSLTLGSIASSGMSGSIVRQGSTSMNVTSEGKEINVTVPPGTESSIKVRVNGVLFAPPSEPAPVEPKPAPKMHSFRFVPNGDVSISSITMSGSVQFATKQLKLARTLEVCLSGASILYIHSQTFESLHFSTSGSSELVVVDCNIEELTGTASGASDVGVFVVHKKIDITASGSSNCAIEYTKGALVRVKETGASTIDTSETV